jgi:hypothetical protein
MPALNIAQPLPDAAPYEDAPPLDAVALGNAPFHLASELDSPVHSPVTAMQARLARELRRSKRRSVKLDLTWPVALLFSLTCWWGLISLGLAVVHGYLHG